jgi:hypothetical protein
MDHVSHVACESSGAERGQPDDASLIAESYCFPERFGAVFDRHAAAIHGYVARRLGRVAADDLVAETFWWRSASAVVMTRASPVPGRGCMASQPG